MKVSTAEEIARRELASRACLKLLDGDAWPEHEPVPMAYGTPEGFPSGCWVVYVESDPHRVGASTVLVIRKEDGSVLFHGETGE